MERFYLMFCRLKLTFNVKMIMGVFTFNFCVVCAKVEFIPLISSRRFLLIKHCTSVVLRTKFNGGSITSILDDMIIWSTIPLIVKMELIVF